MTASAQGNCELDLVICSDTLPGVTLGGRDQRIMNMAPLLARSGVRIRLVTLARKGAPPTLCDGAVQVCPVAPALVRDERGKRSWLNAVILNVAAAWWLLWHRAGLVELDQIPCAALPLPLLSCWLTRKAVLVQWVEGWSLREWAAYLGPLLGWLAFLGERLTFRLAPAMANSHFTASRLKAIHRRPRKRVDVAPPGFAISVRPPRACRRYHLGFVGRLTSHKRVDRFIQLVAELAPTQPDLRALVIGEGDQFDAALRLAADLGVLDRLDFVGRLETHAEVLSAMSDMELLVVCSEREGFGLVVLEANAHGVPVLVRDAPASASRTLIQPGVNGFVCADADMAAAAAQTLADSSVTQRLRRGALLAAQRYSAGAALSSLLRGYRQVAPVRTNDELRTERSDGVAVA